MMIWPLHMPFYHSLETPSDEPLKATNPPDIKLCCCNSAFQDVSTSCKAGESNEQGFWKPCEWKKYRFSKDWFLKLDMTFLLEPGCSWQAFLVIRGNQQLVLGSLGGLIILSSVGIKNDQPFYNIWYILFIDYGAFKTGFTIRYF